MSVYVLTSLSSKERLFLRTRPVEVRDNLGSVDIERIQIPLFLQHIEVPVFLVHKYVQVFIALDKNRRMQMLDMFITITVQYKILKGILYGQGHYKIRTIKHVRFT